MVKKVFLIIIIFILLIGITIHSNATNTDSIISKFNNMTVGSKGGYIFPNKSSYNFNFLKSREGIVPKVQDDTIKLIIVENIDFWIENILGFICLFGIFLLAIKKKNKKNSMLLFFTSLVSYIFLKVACRAVEGIFKDYLTITILIKITKYIIYCMLTIVMIIILNVKTEKLNKKAVVSFIIFNVILVIMSGMLCYNRNNITANILTSAHGDVDIEVRTLKEGDKILQHEVKDINLFYIELLDSDRKSYKYSINKYYYTDYRNTITDCGDHISYVVFDK